MIIGSKKKKDGNTESLEVKMVPLLTESVRTTKVTLSSEYYQFDQNDEHHSNVMHGTAINCRHHQFTTNPVSCMMFSDCLDAVRMKDHLETLNDTIGTVGSVIKTIGIFHLKALEQPSAADVASQEPEFHFGTIPTPSPSAAKTPVATPQDQIVLVTGIIETTTFREWLNVHTCHEDAFEFFSNLFLMVKKLHKKNLFIGNVRDAIRVCPNNKPILVFPAKCEAFYADDGIWTDLSDLQKMVSESKLRVNSELKLFNDMCRRFVGGQRIYGGNKLREFSYLILSGPIIWKSSFRYDFIRKLGELRETMPTYYQWLVDDTEHEAGVPSMVGWYRRLENAAPQTDAAILQKVYQHKNAAGYPKGSEGIRYFQRCVYEHLKECETFPRVSDILYNVFPEAPSALYHMMVEKLYLPSFKNPDPMPLDFLWTPPHCFDP